MQNRLCIDVAAGRLEPEGEAEVPKIIIVWDAVSTKVDLDGKGLHEKQLGKLSRKWKQSKGEDWTEMRKEEKEDRKHTSGGVLVVADSNLGCWSRRRGDCVDSRK